MREKGGKTRGSVRFGGSKEESGGAEEDGLFFKISFHFLNFFLFLLFIFLYFFSFHFLIFISSLTQMLFPFLVLQISPK